MADPDAFDAVAAAKELDDLLGGDNEYVAKLEADLEAAKDEIEAVKKRVENAAKKELEQRTRKILETFLPVVDDLDRGIVAANAVAESKDVVVGLELVRRSMLTQLAQFGVTRMDVRGEPFDPQRHEAIALVPVTDAAQDNRVIDVMREGYLVNGDTLRAAGVAVGKRS